MRFAQRSGYRSLLPPLIVEISRAQRNAGENERRRRREWHRIERRGRKRHDAVFIGARRSPHVTPRTRRAKFFREILQARRQIRIASRNAMSASDDVRPKLR